MAINNNKPLFLFDQNLIEWLYWDYSKNTFVKMDETPIISGTNFTGIGARIITKSVIKAIEDLFKNHLNNDFKSDLKQQLYV